MISVPISVVVSVIVGLLGLITLAVTVGTKIGSRNSKFVTKVNFGKYKESQERKCDKTKCSFDIKIDAIELRHENQTEKIYDRINEVLEVVNNMAVTIAKIGK